MSLKVIYTCVNLVVLMTVCSAYTLKATPETVFSGQTRDVELECNASGGTTPSLPTVNRIRLEKLVNGTWSLLSEIVDVNNHINYADSSVIASGFIGSPSATYLTVTWPIASADTPGAYRCQIVGLDGGQNIAVQRSDPVIIKDGSAGNPTLAQVAHQQNLLQAQLNSLNDHTSQELSDILNLIRENQLMEFQQFNFIHNQLNALAQAQAALDHRLTALEGSALASASTPDSFTTTSTSIETTPAPTGMSTAAPTTSPLAFNNGMQWPRGSYGLLRPASGCPANTPFISWVRGDRHHRTESNLNEVSVSNHMPFPVTDVVNGSYFIHQRFCVAEDPAYGNAWPRGSYCINRKGGHCPSGFHSGYINIDDISNGQDRTGSLPDGIFDSATTIYYCCRNDSSPFVPMVLPTGLPFYLYRFDTVCQEVAGMNVENEWIIIDTEESDNQDFYENEWHPSGRLNDVSIQLCYYERPIIQ